MKPHKQTYDATTIRYQLTNHLDSASIELDQNADIISYEEYHPFGTTSYRSGRSAADVSLKRYKYVFKELDNETGLYYYGMRYYAPWVARFVSVDPLQSDYPYYTPFQYAGNKPISYIDLDGAEEAKKITSAYQFYTSTKHFMGKGMNGYQPTDRDDFKTWGKPDYSQAYNAPKASEISSCYQLYTNLYAFTASLDGKSTLSPEEMSKADDHAAIEILVMAALPAVAGEVNLLSGYGWQAFKATSYFQTLGKASLMSRLFAGSADFLMQTASNRYIGGESWRNSLYNSNLNSSLLTFSNPEARLSVLFFNGFISNSYIVTFSQSRLGTPTEALSGGFNEMVFGYIGGKYEGFVALRNNKAKFQLNYAKVQNDRLDIPLNVNIQPRKSLLYGANSSFTPFTINAVSQINSFTKYPSAFLTNFISSNIHNNTIRNEQ